MNKATKSDKKPVYIVNTYLARLEYEDFSPGSFKGKNTSKQAIKNACLSCIDRSPFGYEQEEEFTSFSRAKNHVKEMLSRKQQILSIKPEKPFFPYVSCYIIYKYIPYNNGYETLYIPEEMPKAFYIKIID